MQLILTFTDHCLNQEYIDQDVNVQINYIQYKYVLNTSRITYKLDKITTNGKVH